MKKWASFLLAAIFLTASCAGVCTALTENLSACAESAPDAEEPVKRPAAEGEYDGFHFPSQYGTVGIFYWEDDEVFTSAASSRSHLVYFDVSDAYLLLFSPDGKLLQVGNRIAYRADHPELDYAVESFTVPANHYFLAFHYDESDRKNQELYDIYCKALGDKQVAHGMTDVVENDFRFVMGAHAAFSIYEGDFPDMHVMTFTEESLSKVIEHPVTENDDEHHWQWSGSDSLEYYLYNPYSGPPTLQWMRAELVRSVPTGKLDRVALTVNFKDIEAIENASVYVTKDGENYTKVGDYQLNRASDDEPNLGLVTTEMTFPETRACGVKVVLDCTGREKANTGTETEYYISEIFVTQFAVSDSNAVPGDLDGNDMLDAADCLKARRAFFGLIPLVKEEVALIDFNGNGEVDANDCLKMRRAFFGLLTLKFPG